MFIILILRYYNLHIHNNALLGIVITTLLLIIYAIIINPIISYWTTRETARGSESGKTSLISSSVLSVLGMIVYIIAVIFVGSQTNVDQNVLFFAIILIPTMFVNQILEAINLGWKPHGASIGFIIFEALC